MTRIIVTGERDWPDDGSVGMALHRIMIDAITGRVRDGWIVVHGDCPTGADRWARNWCEFHAQHGARDERHPADWKGLGAKAGPMRSQHMINLGARLCVAFWSGRVTGPDGKGRSGTLTCITFATLARIPVRIVPPA